MWEKIERNSKKRIWACWQAWLDSEGGRIASVSFPCTAGESYYIFWNAEYVPGRFAWDVAESCAASDCVRAHRMRHLMMMMMRHRHKALRRRLK